MYRTEDGWIKAYAGRDAYLEQADDPKLPHMLLSGGDHSIAFFNSGKVLEDPLLNIEACWDLIEKLERAGCNTDLVDRVVSPAMGAITFGYALALAICIRRGRVCYHSYAEKHKDWDRNNRTMVFNREPAKAGEKILLAEDVWTTGGSIELVADLVKSYGCVALPYRVMLVVRSGETEKNGATIVSLINRVLPRWAPHECPRCKLGSEAIPPKKPASNWLRLKGIAA